MFKRTFTFKRILQLIFISLAFSTFFFLNQRNVQAETLEELQEQSRQLTEELERIRAEKAQIDAMIANEDAKQSSLSQTISYLAYQIRSTELTIEEKEGLIEKNEAEIKVLGVEISNTQEQITALEDAIEYLDSVVGERARASYINSKITPVELIASTKNLSSLIKKVKYFAAIREHDIELMTDLTDNKVQLSEHKVTLSDQKAEVEELKAEIESEKESLERATAELAWQKEQQNQLLAESLSKETQYNSYKQELSSEEQEKSAQLSAIQTQIALAAFGIGGEDVKQGDFIGRQGNTGYSFGSHLHFMVKDNGQIQNPLTYLNNGTLEWPISGARITQLFGMTDFATKCQPAQGETGFDWYTCWYGPPMVRQISNPYAYPRKYGYYPYDGDRDGYPNIHNGLDMAATDGSPIHAVADGKVCFGHDWYGAQYAIIEHANELYTYYWHMQEMNLNTCN